MPPNSKLLTNTGGAPYRFWNPKALVDAVAGLEFAVQHAKKAGVPKERIVFASYVLTDGRAITIK